MKQLHHIQLDILNSLLFKDKGRYSQIKPYGVENSQFVFHINKLVKTGYVLKENSTYSLTETGKEYANRITTESGKIERMVKSTVVLIPCRKKNNEVELLIYQRLKNPFYGCYGFGTEKPKWGESFSDAAIRGLKEETNLDGAPKLIAIRHYIVKRECVVLEDKLMHAYLFENPNGKLTSIEEGKYFWSSPKRFSKYKRKLEEFDDFYNAFINFTDEEISFKEVVVETSNF